MGAFQIFTLVLVFCAVIAVVWVFAINFLRETEIKTSEGKVTDVNLADPMARFVSPGYLTQLRCSAALLFGGIALCIPICFQVFDLWVLVIVTVIPAVLGFFAPKWFFNAKVRARQLAFQKKMLDLVMGLTNGLRAGMALPQALEVVSRDIGGPLQEEVSIALYEYRLGIELPEALDRVSIRMPGEDFKLLTTSVRLSMQTGGSMADVLDRMTDTIRQRTVFQEKLRTLTAQGRFEAIAIASAPLVAFLVLYFIDPILMGPLVQTKLGWAALGVVALLETIGFLIINKIVTIEA